MKESLAAGNYLILIMALLIPLTSYLTQVISIKLTSSANKNSSQNDMLAQQMKTMNTMMPLMSLFFCFTLPVGLGIYWIVSAAYRSVQQVTINKFIQNMNLDDIIEKNKEKAKKKQEQRGIYESQMREAAAMKTRTIETRANYSNYKEVDTDAISNTNRTYKPGSMAAKANMVREYNEKNSRK
jgi:YidC/Oxa1 family membrane protein insertase